MNKKYLFYCTFGFILIGSIFYFLFNNDNSFDVNVIEAKIIEVSDDLVKVEDSSNAIYTFKANVDGKVGDDINLTCTGSLNLLDDIQDCIVTDYSITTIADDNKELFEDYYSLADEVLAKLSLEEKVGQLFLVRYPDKNAIQDLKKYGLSGFVFFSKDFDDKSKDDVRKMMQSLQDNANIGLLLAVDEEGGKINRVSNHDKLADVPFKSPMALYDSGKFEAIKDDTISKSKFLYDLGINVNLAPVVDIASEGDYIYDRTIGLDATGTSTYAKTVIQNARGTGVSYVLKHFPGYGSNADTHLDSSDDNRSKDEIMNNDILPFKSGISSLAEAVLVSHNIVKGIDKDNPASLSKDIINILKNDLGFSGVCISDNLDMGAVAGIKDVAVLALKAGNDLIITTDYETGINDVLDSIKDGNLSESLVNEKVKKILAWKFYKGLIVVPSK